MLALYRVRRPGAPDAPYREYHSSDDTAARVPDGVLEASRDVVLHLLRALDANVTPRHRFPGEPFCSRFGVHVDPFTNPAGARVLFDLLARIDGTHTVADLADACGVGFGVAHDLVALLARRGVIDV
jgi:aminopeptidase-like protein